MLVFQGVSDNVRSYLALHSDPLRSLIEVTWALQKGHLGTPKRSLGPDWYITFLVWGGRILLHVQTRTSSPGVGPLLDFDLRMRSVNGPTARSLVSGEESPLWNQWVVVRGTSSFKGFP